MSIAHENRIATLERSLQVLTRHVEDLILQVETLESAITAPNVAHVDQQPGNMNEAARRGPGRPRKDVAAARDSTAALVD